MSWVLFAFLICQNVINLIAINTDHKLLNGISELERRVDQLES